MRKLSQLSVTRKENEIVAPIIIQVVACMCLVVVVAEHCHVSLLFTLNIICKSVSSFHFGPSFASHPIRHFGT